MTNRSVNGSPTAYTVNDLNEMTGYSGYTLIYDNNGNLVTNGVTGCTLVYDDENRLVQWFVSVPQNGSPRTDFVYDGLGRLRKRLEWNWDDGSTAPGRLGPLVGAGGWVIGAEIRYIYDGKRVIQERNVNVPSVTYTRGNDLSGSLEGAGGIGGLLARSSGYSGGNWTSHAFYHADGNGNITYMISSAQAMVAAYKYDPYGRTISSSGTLAAANLYRFSSKEFHANGGMYYYLCRFYDPQTQRWLNRDPITEQGFTLLAAIATPPTPESSSRQGLWNQPESPNAYEFADNTPISNVDLYGLKLRLWPFKKKTPVTLKPAFPFPSGAQGTGSGIRAKIGPSGVCGVISIGAQPPKPTTPIPGDPKDSPVNQPWNRPIWRPLPGDPR